MAEEYEALRRTLEELGEDPVRIKPEWLSKLEAERATREALDARKIAQRANTIAIIAIIVATFALLHDFLY
jgi:hypothetical protein